MFQGYKFIKKKNVLSPSDILNIQETIVQNNAGFRKIPGAALKNEKTDEIIYTPIQSFEKIQQLIHNYTGYFNEIEYSLIRMAILHYQFGCIHPFYDGNGRKGIEKTSKDTITKINDIKRLMNKIIEEVK